MGYDDQARGDDDAYQRYLNGMDKSMRQKVATTAAHLLGEGTVADMGMGSGTGSAALASLYPRLHVVGVDVNPEMVTRATQRFSFSNLSFVAGDVAARVFESGSLTGIFDSSVLHHVTSFNGYDYDAARRALREQVAQLADGGTLIVRDFLAPAPGQVLLDVPDGDGDPSDDPARCSTASLLERFSKEFKQLSPKPGFELKRVHDAAGLQPGWRRYLLEHRFAVEFLLRKDYREDWASEVLEEYTYFDQAQFEAEFAKLELRLLASIPISNPWIVKHRFKGHFELRALDGRVLDYPFTNYLIVGERVAPKRGVRFELGRAQPPTGFLKLHVFQDVEDGSLRDLVRRPGTTIDIFPWFSQGDALYALVRRSRPRPILQANADPLLDGSSPIGYVTEPILAIMSDKPLAMTVEDALLDAASIGSEGIYSIQEAGTYYPSPGGIVEEVRAAHVEVRPCFVSQIGSANTDFSTQGTTQAIDVRQLLRAAQVGALPDARLELNAYELLFRLGAELGPWIGAELAMPEPDEIPGERFSELELKPRRRYVNAPPQQASGFLERCCYEFEEKDAGGNTLFSAPREFVIPRTRSTNTVACALLRRYRDEVLLGVDEDDLPAAQAFAGSSAILVAPAWRIPKGLCTLGTALAWVTEQLVASYGVSVESATELGGRYQPSCGITPEAVYPLALVVRLVGTAQSRLHWVPLREVARDTSRVRDGHLRILALRAAHALQLLS